MRILIETVENFKLNQRVNLSVIEKGVKKWRTKYIVVCVVLVIILRDAAGKKILNLIDYLACVLMLPGYPSIIRRDR